MSERCGYQKNNHETDIKWSNKSCGIDYQQSDFLQPKDSGIPVILDGKHLSTEDDRIFCAMYWSLIPPWYKVSIFTYMYNVQKYPCITNNLSKLNLRVI